MNVKRKFKMFPMWICVFVNWEECVKVHGGVCVKCGGVCEKDGGVFEGWKSV